MFIYLFYETCRVILKMKIRFYTIQEFRKTHPNNLNEPIIMSFKTSEGERVTKTFIDGQIRKTKKQFVDDAREEGREYCWACGTTNDRLTCSHIISVNDCQNDSRTEIAYLYDNLQLECISNGCHMETETGNISHHANARYKKEFIERYNNGEV